MICFQEKGLTNTQMAQLCPVRAIHGSLPLKLLDRCTFWEQRTVGKSCVCIEVSSLESESLCRTGQKGTNYWPASTTRDEKPRAQHQQRQTQAAEPAKDREHAADRKKARFCQSRLGQHTLSLQTQSQHHHSGFNSCPAFLNMVSVDHGGHSEDRGYIT